MLAVIFITSSMGSTVKGGGGGIRSDVDIEKRPSKSTNTNVGKRNRSGLHEVFFTENFEVFRGIFRETRNDSCFS